MYTRDHFSLPLPDMCDFVRARSFGVLATHDAGRMFTSPLPLDLREEDGELVVVLTPTYSGCPATEAIAADVRKALSDFEPLRITQRFDPAWTTDWIGPEAREKLRAYGIAPPSGTAAVTQPLRLHEAIPCPRCGSPRSERLSAFGSTACKAQYRCADCLEPFDHFKPH